MKWSIFIFTLLFFETKAQTYFEEASADQMTVEDARGVAIGDYDNDGDDDVFITGTPSRLFRNEGNWHFTDVTDQTGLIHDSYTALWIDLDNDGYLDLVSSSYEESYVYMNSGNGTMNLASSFNRARRQALLGGDLNGDGWVDVFSANLNDPHELLLNAGDGLLIDEAREAGITQTRIGMGGILTDIDHDGDLDIYLVYDGYQTSELFVNDGSGHFEEQAALWGLDTESQAMGLDAEDINGDGQPDFYITNLFENYLLMSRENGPYLEEASQAGVDDYGMGWGTRLFDVNNDGYSDIYVHNDFTYSPYTNKLYINKGDNKFIDLAANTALENRLSGYGMATSDLDDDGLQDIILVNQGADGSVRLFRNLTQDGGNWIQLDLAGVDVNSRALGAIVKVSAGGRNWQKTVRAGAGWISQHGYRQYFGLGAISKVDSVTVKWPGGGTDTYTNVPVNQRTLLVQRNSAVPFEAAQYDAAMTNSRLSVEPTIKLPELPDVNYTVSRQWMEALLLAVRNDYARPTVHARNIFHLSIAMYDAWSVFEGNTYLLGKNLFGYQSLFDRFETSIPTEEARNTVISYAAYRLLKHRFAESPGRGITMAYFNELMEQLGYDVSYQNTEYSNGDPRALGNYIAQEVIRYGKQDGSNEENNYDNEYYLPVNDPLFPFDPGNPSMTDPNRWQPLELLEFIDQRGNADGSAPPFLGPEWGNVLPFAMDTLEADIRFRDGNAYRVYHDPGPPPSISDQQGLSDLYKWNHTMVSIWGSHLDPEDGIEIDISPASSGNISDYPSDYTAFYKYFVGGDPGTGYDINPITGQAYSPYLVPLGDYARVIAEFWADGPDSETPPGHWVTILNYVFDQEAFEPRWMGTGELMDKEEWLIRAYFTLGGAMHDAAVAAWSIKGFYDYVRPISAIRYMADRGQSSDPLLPSFHPHGLPLIPGYVELIAPDDPLAGADEEHTNKIKLYTWRGHSFIDNPDTDKAGVGWIRGEDWFSYQRPTFVTPPFAGYVSGHSTFSNAAANVLSQITGNEFFPGGLGEFVARKNEFLVFEEGPGTDVVLQWARYQDAADQSSISRIWGGIHPPADDLPGRRIGQDVGSDAVVMANSIFEGETVTSLEKPEGGFVKIFPNPARAGTVLSIITSDEPIQMVQIMDINGRVISEETVINRQRVRVNLGVLKPGIYVVVMHMPNNVYAERLLIR